jgi:hypothetical protein
VEFEPTNPVFERAKMVHALYGAATVIDSCEHGNSILLPNEINLIGTIFSVRKFRKTTLSLEARISVFGPPVSLPEPFYSFLDLHFYPRTETVGSSETLITIHQTIPCHFIVSDVRESNLKILAVCTCSKAHTTNVRYKGCCRNATLGTGYWRKIVVSVKMLPVKQSLPESTPVSRTDGLYISRRASPEPRR